MAGNDDAKKAAEKKAAEKKAADKKIAEAAAKKPAGGKKTSLPERPKAGASESGNPGARSKKLGAFQPLRGTYNATSGTDEWSPYDPKTREFILVSYS